MKVKFDTAFYRDLTIAAINSLGEYYQTMESQLATLKAEDRNKIHSDIEDLVLDEEQKRAERDLAIDEHTAKYEMLFTNFFRYSFVVLLGLVVENRLWALCNAVYDLKKISTQVPSPRKNIIEKYREYLLQCGVSVSERLWEPITTLSKVRNCIVHASGKVSRSRDEEYLRNVATRDLGILISDIHSKGNLQPLYLEDNMIVLETKYCSQIGNDITKLFEQLCDAVPLYSSP